MSFSTVNSSIQKKDGKTQSCSHHSVNGHLLLSASTTLVFLNLTLVGSFILMLSYLAQSSPHCIIVLFRQLKNKCRDYLNTSYIFTHYVA